MQIDVSSAETVPSTLLEHQPLDGQGPWPTDWRVGAVSGHPGAPSWVAVRVEPFEVLPPVAERDTAVVLAALRARREGATVWTLTGRSAWTQWDAWR